MVFAEIIFCLWWGNCVLFNLCTELFSFAFIRTGSLWVACCFHAFHFQVHNKLYLLCIYLHQMELRFVKFGYWFWHGGKKKDKVSCSKMFVTLVKDVCFSFLQFQRTPLPFANGSFYKGVRHIKVYDCYHAYISVSYFFLAIN